MARGGARTSSGLLRCQGATARATHSIRPEVHLRPPSIDQGVQAGVWAISLAVIIWLGMLSVGVSGATAVIMAALAGAVIFFYVRLFGEDKPKPRRTERS
jgi:hypothetical protein